MLSSAAGKTDYTKPTPTDEDDIIRELAEYLESQYSADELHTAKARYVEEVWPEVYINSETKKPYKPHNEEERLICYSEILGIPLVHGLCHLRLWGWVSCSQSYQLHYLA
ncbi:unnamed protein product [marine sediment metagenome]|uniref:Uncharacterized protein n=1 Tax=marine sediment metagenome TaxID=412755 RepID=X1P4L5_9ZZZZ